MIVYGDPEFTISAADAVRAIERLQRTAENRDLLIACGQLEQAVADSSDATEFAALTDAAADRFLGIPSKLKRPRLSLTSLRIKIPEGYAFYNLFPEQYARSADAWAESHPRSGRTLVVGIRSIGTSLSAVVAAKLRAAGLVAHRITIRPGGHPFSRETNIPLPCERFQHAIVVDEGPGLSGSSIASVVVSLREVGIQDISIFPGHPGEPGHAASAETRAIWQETPRFVFPHPFRERLIESTERVLGSPVTAVHDLSAGQWRNHLKVQAPATPALERAKFLVRVEDGGAVLWKYAGIGTGEGFRLLLDEASDRQKRLAQLGWCTAPLGSIDGFIASEWIEGERPSHCPVPQLSRYIVESAKPASRDTAGPERLAEILRANLAAFPSGLERYFCKVPAHLPAYGDGRLGPHEWLVRDGQLTKTDVWGHDCDHTFVGTQSVLWDIAGAIVEWNMTLAERNCFLDALRQSFDFAEPQLAMFELAYAGFHFGIATMFSDSERASYFQRRLNHFFT